MLLGGNDALSRRSSTRLCHIQDDLVFTGERRTVVLVVVSVVRRGAPPDTVGCLS